MNIIDLTQTVSEGMQIYPGDPHPSIDVFLDFESDYCHVNKIQIGSHTGTHIDTPYHFLKDGKKINDYPLERFVGTGILVDVSEKKAEEPINRDDLKPYLSKIKPKDFIIFKTGWELFWGKDKYHRHPYLTAKLAKQLVDMQISLVGIDALNVDPTLGNIYPVHEILLKNDILIVENLCNLNAVDPLNGYYSFLPLKLDGSDGSPIRAAHLSDRSA